MHSRDGEMVEATFRDGRIEPDQPACWPEGTRLLVTSIAGRPDADAGKLEGHVIIAGFGLAGRYVADLLKHAGLAYTIIEKNPVTVETQRALGKKVILGDVTDAQTLEAAGLASASILALTIPDEEAVLRATSLARKLRLEIYIIARTNYSSQGLRASQQGADEVVKAEQAVALQFYERLSRRIRRTARDVPSSRSR